MKDFLNNLWLWLRGRRNDALKETGHLPIEEITSPSATPSSIPERKAPIEALIVRNDSEEQLALLTMSDELRDKIVDWYQEQWLTSGSLIDNGGKIAPHTILSIVGAATGSAGLGTALSGKLFIATANPSTLMALQGGVGSAVIGTGGGIVAQAPFMAASGLIAPIAAPIIVFQAISTFIVMKGFALVREELIKIEGILQRILQRSEATFASELVAISHRLASLEEQFSDERQFSIDMTVRLALVEERVEALSERYRLLSGSQNVKAETTEDTLQFKTHDTRLAIIASGLKLRVGYLRLSLLLQESPTRMHLPIKHFSKLCDQHESLLRKIKEEENTTKTLIEDLNTHLDTMSAFQRRVTKRSEYKRSQEAREKLQRHRERQDEIAQQEFAAAEKLGQRAKSAIKIDDDIALIYWRDEFGEHSYYVEELPDYVKEQLIK